LEKESDGLLLRVSITRKEGLLLLLEAGQGQRRAGVLGGGRGGVARWAQWGKAGSKKKGAGDLCGETGRDPGVIRGRGCCCAGVARPGKTGLACGPELAAGPSERRTRNAEAGARGRRDLIGSRLGRAWPVPASQAPTAQAQRMQRHPDWITALN